MPKSASSKLYFLIKSMSKSEKRHFRLLSAHSSGEPKNYLELFTIIENLKEYNEKQIAEKCKNIKQLPVLKVRLYDLVLTRLHLFRANLKTSDATLKILSNQIEVLLEKRFFNQAGKKLSKAKKLAYAYEKYSQLIELLSAETKLFYLKSFKGVPIKAVDNNHEELLNALKQYKELELYRHFHLKTLHSLFQQGISRTPTSGSDFEKILRNPLMNPKQAPTSFFSGYHYYYTLSSCYFALQNFRKAHIMLKAGLGILEKYPHLKKENITFYTTILSNITSCLGLMNKHHEAITTLKKIRTLTIKSPLTKYEIYFSSAARELSAYSARGLFKECIPLVHEVEKVLTESKEYLNEVIAFPAYLRIAGVYFGAGDFSSTKKYLNKIINSENRKIRNDLYSIAMVMMLIVNYELGNMAYLDYLARNTQRYLVQQKQLFAIESIIIKFIKVVLPKTKNEQDLTNAFKKMKADFEKQKQAASEKIIEEFFDFSSWLESKITTKSYADIIKLKKAAQ